MQKITIAFDVDWTLINNEKAPEIIANENIRTLLICLSTFKNVKIIVWSGGWELYARQVVRILWLESYVWKIMSKNHQWIVDWKHVFEPWFKPSLAIDDIQSCELWILNLIVKEK